MFLQHICNKLEIDPTKGLFVVPGNHDYRISGLYSGFIFKKITGVAAKKGIDSDFNNVFSPYFRSATIVSECSNASYPIAIKLVSLDSNDTDAALNCTGSQAPAWEPLPCKGCD